MGPNLICTRCGKRGDHFAGRCPTLGDPAFDGKKTLSGIAGRKKVNTLDNVDLSNATVIPCLCRGIVPIGREVPFAPGASVFELYITFVMCCCDLEKCCSLLMLTIKFSHGLTRNPMSTTALPPRVPRMLSRLADSSTSLLLPRVVRRRSSARTAATTSWGTPTRACSVSSEMGTSLVYMELIG